ncbi:MAG: hypothetical protein Q7U47_04460 [Paludibacter sp.]|nr:hypothetical protein [Paludibacter sp.]
MKKLLLILFIIPLLSNENIKVYVCTSIASKRYHKSTECEGMQACKAIMRIVTLDDAKRFGKTPCGFCYPSNNLEHKIKEGQVYICTSNNSKRYHNSLCEGMQSCSCSTKIVTLIDAIEIGKTPCRFCFPSDKTETISDESDINKEWWGDKYP